MRLLVLATRLPAPRLARPVLLARAVLVMPTPSSCHDSPVGLFKRSEAVRARVGAHARYAVLNQKQVDTITSFVGMR